MRKEHTHKGHCQACGRIQALTVVGMAILPRLAKHGYKVAGFGYFSGTCQGSARLPLQQDKTYCEAIQGELSEYAARQESVAKAYDSGELVPSNVEVYDSKAKGGLGLLKWEAADEYQRANELRSRIWRARNEAKSARDHAEMLRKLAEEIFNTPVIAVEPKAKPLAITIGMEFAINGSRWKVKSLVRRGWRGNGNPNHAVCDRISNLHVNAALNVATIPFLHIRKSAK